MESSHGDAIIIRVRVFPLILYITLQRLSLVFILLNSAFFFLYSPHENKVLIKVLLMWQNARISTGAKY